jgi:hypothetical protein
MQSSIRRRGNVRYGPRYELMNSRTAGHRRNHKHIAAKFRYHAGATFQAATGRLCSLILFSQLSSSLSRSRCALIYSANFAKTLSIRSSYSRPEATWQYPMD